MVCRDHGSTMSNGPVQTLHTSLGPLEVELPAELAEDAAGSLEFIQNAAQSIRFASAMSVYFRVMLGRQLLVVQERALWQQFGMPDCGTWSKFLDIGFPRLAGLSRETAYGALQLAKCKAIAGLPPIELRRFECLANAVELARAERHGADAGALIEAAMGLPCDDFRALVGKGKPAKIEVLLDNPEVYRPLLRITNWLKRADVDTLQKFWETLERAKLYGGDNPDDSLDSIMAACYFQWAQEQES